MLSEPVSTREQLVVAHKALRKWLHVKAKILGETKVAGTERVTTEVQLPHISAL